MKLCVPTAGTGGLDDHVGEHFGRVPTYTIYDTETSEVKVIDNTSSHMGGSGLPGEHLATEGIDVVLCAGLGRRAIALLSENEICVYSGASGSVREAIEHWKRGNLSQAEPCTRHVFHGQDD